jgi:hypothetical protein
MSYVDRRNDLLKHISGAFVSATKSAASGLDFTGISYINIDCDTSGNVDSCYQCLMRYYSKEYIDDPTKLTDVNKMKRTLCRGMCTCSVKNVDNNAVITLNSLAQIKTEDIDVDKISADVYAAMVKKYGPSGAGMNKDDLTKLVVSIQSSIKQNIKQTVHSIQMLSLEGTGSDVDGLSQKAVIDATMAAVTETCTENQAGSTCTVSAIDELIQQQMDYIKKSVDDSFGFSFSKVWNNLKFYIITTGLFLLFLVVVIIVLMIRKAMKG